MKTFEYLYLMGQGEEQEKGPINEKDNNKKKNELHIN